MTDLSLTRRALCTTLTGAAGLSVLGSTASLAAGSGTGTVSPLQRYMKIYASLTPGTIWYWYSGIIEASQPEAPVIPLVGIETLIRREMTLGADGNFKFVTTEANYFHAIGDARPLNSMVNPITGRLVEPFHFTEGPRTNVVSEQSLAPRKMKAIETSVEWRTAGPYTWLYRTLHAESAHPLDINKWPLEASGKRNRTGSFSTHCALTRDVLDPSVSNAPCSFNYEAVFGWLPWLLMGQRPGDLVWRGTGMKLPALADLPGDARAGFETVFPEIFTGVGFGRNGAFLWDEFQRKRSPAKP